MEPRMSQNQMVIPHLEAVLFQVEKNMLLRMFIKSRSVTIIGIIAEMQTAFLANIAAESIT